MVDVNFIIYSAEGAREVPMTTDCVSIGRGEIASLMIDDDGLSRLHATIHRDGERVWILDESSTNGSYVNGVPVPPIGTPLADGDEITLGNQTIIAVRQHIQTAQTKAPETLTVSHTGQLTSPHLAVMIGAIIIFLAAVVIASQLFDTNGNNDRASAGNKTTTNITSVYTPGNSHIVSPTESVSTTTATRSSDGDRQIVKGDANTLGTVTTRRFAGKLYRDMSEEEKKRFVEDQAKRISISIAAGSESPSFTPEVVNIIKNRWVEIYQKRLGARRVSRGAGCSMNDDLRTIMERGKKSAPVINRAFREKNLSPVVGLYLAWIESRYCDCLSSGTGPKGMFQFASKTARDYGVKNVTHWTDKSPDDRCDINIMAPKAADYMTFLIARFGRGPLSVPLAIAAYNSGEGDADKNIQRAMAMASGGERSFWTEVAESKHLTTQFKRENVKYVPNFFAAAIIGENPRVFGVEMEPLSSY